MTVEQNIVNGNYSNNFPYNPNTWSEFHDESRRLKALFKSDLEAEHGLAGHPKADLLFDIAWEHGHANGYYDVEIHYSELAELLK
jgi:hypothetical protein